jgi:branched-chain amino acid aminotransferase
LVGHPRRVAQPSAVANERQTGAPWALKSPKVPSSRRAPNLPNRQPSLTIRAVNCHIESTYTVQTGTWTAPTAVGKPQLSLHGLSPALNYGLQAFEGIKAYRTAGGRIAIFRPTANGARLARSTAFLAIPSIPPAHFLACVRLAVGANAAFVPPAGTGAALYIRPLVFGSSPQLSLAPPEEFTFCVYVSPTGTYHGAHAVDALVLEDFDRAAPEGSGAVKIGGNYGPVFRFSEQARADGFGITLHLDSKTRTEIDEFTTSGFLGVRVEAGKVVVVVPDSKSVIESVTAGSACEIARSCGWTVERRRVPFEELPSFSEVIAAGTAAALVPVRSITMRSTGRRFVYGEAGWPVLSRLLETLRGIQMGTVADGFGWLDYVDDAQGGSDGVFEE